MNVPSPGLQPPSLIRWEREGVMVAIRSLRTATRKLQRRLSQEFQGHQFFSLSAMELRRGLGRGGAFFKIPLSSVLSPFVPHGARKKPIGLLRQSRGGGPCRRPAVMAER